MRQQGSVLIVSLGFLLIMSIAGMATINSSSIEGKVAGNFSAQQVAFQAGEAALLMAEKYINDTDLNLANFTSACNVGLCFSGTDRDRVFSCSALDVSPWEEAGLWSDTTRVKGVTVKLDGKELNAWYIIEFRCNVPVHAYGASPNFGSSSSWSQYFRITVRANGESKNSRVMLQITYIK